MRMLITGRSGQIGACAATYFENLGYDVWSCGRKGGYGKQHFSNCDLTHLPSTEFIINRVSPDIVLHLAANPIVRHDEKRPNDLLMTNIIGTNNLLHCLSSKTLVVFASSITTYSNKNMLNVEQNALSANSIYATSKITCENLLYSYKELKGIEYSIVRLGATIGPNLTHGLIKDCINKVRNDEVVNLFGIEPGPTKPYTYILDVLDGIQTVILNNIMITNVCNTNVITVKKVAETIMDTLNIHKDIVWSPQANWKGDSDLSAYNGLLRSYGWKPRYDSTEAVRKTVQDILELEKKS